MSARRRTDSRIGELIEEAIVDCYDESEQICGFLNMLEEYLSTPFSARVVGVQVSIEGSDHAPSVTSSRRFDARDAGIA